MRHRGGKERERERERETYLGVQFGVAEHADELLEEGLVGRCLVHARRALLDEDVDQAEGEEHAFWVALGQHDLDFLHRGLRTARHCWLARGGGGAGGSAGPKARRVTYSASEFFTLVMI